MRVLLLGGTDVTLVAADALMESGQDIAAAVHLPEEFAISYRPAFHNSRHADVAGWARSRGVPSVAYENPDQLLDVIRDESPEIGLAAGWYHMVPRRVRSGLPLGCLGLHASLLPRLRGGAPLAWAILSGATETGVSLFVLSDGVDDGPLYGQRSFPLGPRTRVNDLVGAANTAVHELIIACFPGIAARTLHPIPQRGEPSYGLQRSPDDGRIRWDRPASEIDRLVRASGPPYPGAFTYLEEERLTVLDVEPMSGVTVWGRPGQVARIDECPDPCVVTGHGVVRVIECVDSRAEDARPLLLRSVHRGLDAIERHK